VWSLEQGPRARERAPDLTALGPGLAVPETAVRVIPNPDSARRARVEVVPVDQLREILPWPGLSAPGRSIAEPILLGIAEDGDPLMIWLPGDHEAQRPAAHYTVVGMSGAGKTEVILNIASEVISRADAELWLADPRKGDQLPLWARTGAARLALDEEGTEQMLEDLYNSIAGRVRQIGAHGHKQWTAGCLKCPAYRVAIIDEAAQVAAGSGLIVGLTEAARSAGISLIFGLQRLSHDRFPTSARSNIPGSICLGVAKDVDASMALSEATLDAGAMPWMWKNTRPGYLYAEVPGTDPERWAMPCRSYVADEQDRAAAVAPYLPQTDDAEQTSQPPAEPAAQRKESAMRDSRDANDEAMAALLGDPPDDVDPAQPIRIPDDMPKVTFHLEKEPPMGTEEARAWLRQYLIDAHQAGVTQVRPGDLADVITATGKGASWVGKELRKLCSGPDALLQQTDRGVYKIRVPEPV